MWVKGKLGKIETKNNMLEGMLASLEGEQEDRLLSEHGQVEKQMINNELRKALKN